MTSRSIFCACLVAALSLAACLRDTTHPAADLGSSPDLHSSCSAAPTATEDTVAMCNDGCDNDANGTADCNDRGCCSVRSDCGAGTVCGTDAGPGMACTGPSVPENTLALCSDGCSNDWADDTFSDCFDYDCCDVRLDCPMGTPCAPMDGGVAMNYTIAQLQNPADAMHPATSSRVTVDQAGMVALTPRVVIGSANPTSGSCRFGIWVGAAVSGDFTAVHVQELVTLPAGMSCFDLPDSKISSAFAPGDAVTSINNATYTEFCAGPVTPVAPCTPFEQSNIFLGGTATIIRGAAGTPPAPSGTVVSIADLAAAAGAPGTRALALEGGLLTVENAQIKSTPDGAYSRYSAFLASAPTVELDILVSNFPATACVRTHFTTLATGTTTVPTITGVLVPNYGRWALRLRDEADVAGLTCP